MVSNELIDGGRIQHASTVEHRYIQISDMYRYVAMQRQRERNRKRKRKREKSKRQGEREREIYESWPAEPHAMLSLLLFLSVKSPGSE